MGIARYRFIDVKNLSQPTALGVGFFTENVPYLELQSINYSEVEFYVTNSVHKFISLCNGGGVATILTKRSTNLDFTVG